MLCSIITIIYTTVATPIGGKLDAAMSFSRNYCSSRVKYFLVAATAACLAKGRPSLIGIKTETRKNRGTGAQMTERQETTRRNRGPVRRDGTSVWDATGGTRGSPTDQTAGGHERFRDNTEKDRPGQQDARDREGQGEA
ncbi:unnamed protein product [Calypogeia fissa]